jgi:PPK2 family polyphosphate:nucleotide phosphotransferase
MATQFDLETIYKRLVVPPGKKINLVKDYQTSWKLAQEMKKQEARGLLQRGVKLLAEFQDKLYAQDTYALLTMFQAMDAAGKDGTIKHVMSGLNPQGCQVYSFKAPSAEELDHDYLWRSMKVLPERGRLGIFNRSYYEEVLVVRVHPELLIKQKLPAAAMKGIWKRRFEQINNFEKYLVENGIVVLKVFLNVSKAEQKKRFLERIDNADKNWKFSASDVTERNHWEEYMDAYQDCFNHTSTEWAPWYIVPADDKRLCRLLVAFLIWRTMKNLNLDYPSVGDEKKAELKKVKAALEKE